MPLVICGPSGVGKGTLLTHLMEVALPNNFAFSVSYTTRGPRPGEEDGVHYNFSTVEDVKARIEKGEFLEHAEVHGNYYGTTFSGLQREDGKIVVLDIDIQGVKNVKKAVEEGKLAGAKYIFISPTDLASLEKRLRDRKTETEEAIQKRTANAAGEMEYGTAEGNFDKIIVNADLETAKAEIVSVAKALYGIE